MLIQVLFAVGAVILIVFAIRAVCKSGFRGNNTGNALQEFHASMDPGVRHTIEEKQKQKVRKEASGDPLEDEL